MDKIIELMRSDSFLIFIMVSTIILLILYITNIIKINKLKKEYHTFMKRLGKGENIQENIDTYMKKIDQVVTQNQEVKTYCQKLDDTISQCIQKVGLIRYNAFKDTGSDLSFTLALLNEENTGIVLNGIYSREMSNIYAKAIQKGKSSYTLSEEEKQAIEQAINK